MHNKIALCVIQEVGMYVEHHRMAFKVFTQKYSA